MASSFDSKIRACLAGALSGALETAIDARKIHLPARTADASVRPPYEIDPAPALAVNFGSLYGAPLVKSIRVENGWLLFEFSAAFYSALVQRVNETIPIPINDDGSHAVNRMLSLARHGGSGCPDHFSFHRALLLGVLAHNSDSAHVKAQRAAESLFRTISLRDQCALLPDCGALGSALARLLAASH